MASTMQAENRVLEVGEEAPKRASRRRRAARRASSVVAPLHAAETPAASPAVERARELLSGDRERAGERRDAARHAPLQTKAYEPTFGERVHAFRHAHWHLFHGRTAERLRTRFRQGLLALGVGVVAAVGWLWLGPAPDALGTQVEAPASAEAAAASPGDSSLPVTAGVQERAARGGEKLETANRGTAPIPVVVAPERAPSQAVAAKSADAEPVGAHRADVEPADAKLDRWLGRLSPRAQVVRADALLRNPHLPPARRARALLENALSEGVGGAHAQAALAEACMRTGDHDCALTAADAALALRPWRGGYRVLRRRILEAKPQ